MIDLGVLGGDANQSEARAISDSGLIVGTSTTPNNSVHAFLWQDGVMTDLGSLTDYASWGYGVNNAAQVVGQYSDGVFGHPYLWDATNGMRDLNSLLEPASGAGWTLYTVNDINNVGQIVGQGRHNGEVRAFVLTPVPEPSAGALVACGVICTAAARRRRLCSRHAPRAVAELPTTIVIANRMAKR
jgi:probable HAF family extracellular repeat protein